MSKENIIRVSLAVICLIIGFTVGRCSKETEDIKVPISITIPEQSGQGPLIPIVKPTTPLKPIYIKGDTVFSENKGDIELIKQLNNITTDKKRLEFLLSQSQLANFSIPLEDDNIKMTTTFTARGNITNFQQFYTRKEIKLDTTIIVPTLKEKFNIYLGGGITSTKEFDNVKFEGNVGFQFKDGKILEGAYNTKNEASLRLKIKL